MNSVDSETKVPQTGSFRSVPVVGAPVVGSADLLSDPRAAFGAVPEIARTMLVRIDLAIAATMIVIRISRTARNILL